MKKSSILFSASIALLSLSAFVYVKGNESDQKKELDVRTETNQPTCQKRAVKAKKEVKSNFFYDLGSRFRGVKKEELVKAKSIKDFLPGHINNPIDSYVSVGVIIIENDEKTDIRETGGNDRLTKGQLNLIKSFDYSTNFLVQAYCKRRYSQLGDLEDCYFTMVPEKEAQYVDGKEELLEYLRANNEKNIFNLDESKLQPAKLYFIVTKDGDVSEVRLDRTSGYVEIDNNMIELMKNLPKKWVPAENGKGQKVNQELVVSFGMIGC
jgi:hypothetical protein